ncbi:MAG: hypothetical protein PW734_11820 [Verrucomicrobium sp.]|nr:hypothetical protein [Verrucomicrobium sp.]
MNALARLACLAALICLAACSGSGTPKVTAEQAAAANAQAAREAPAEYRSRYAELLTGGEQDYVLRAMRLGLDAIHSGDHAFAAKVFDQAIRRVAALQEGSTQADRAKSKFVAEQEKWFKGENYERSSLYLYRGLLYLEAGDYGNAAACAKRCELEDVTNNEQTQGDWYSAEWLLAMASLLQGDPGTARDALARAANFPSKQGLVPKPDADWNVIIIGEAGRGPIKVRRGRYGEQLFIEEGSCRTLRLTVGAGDAKPVVTAAAENLYYQASTRGDRKVDHILHGKAVFKDATNMAGDAAIVAGAGTALTSDNQTQSLVGLGLIVGGVISKAISGAAEPQADIRAWDNLPHSLFLTGLRCPPGAAKIRIEAREGNESVVSTVTKDITVSGSNKTYIWLKFP